MPQNEVEKKTAVGTLNRESKITILTLLKNYYDEEIFNLLVKEIYNPDPAVSEAAIRSSGSLGNETAVQHLYQVIEKGKTPQRIAAIQSLKSIRAPSSTGMLVKYFNHFPEEALRAEILRAINAISPNAQQVMELNGAVYADPKQTETVKQISVESIVESERYALLKDTLPRAPAGVQYAAFLKMLQTGTQEVPDFALDTLSPDALGSYLCVTTLKAKNPQGTAILEALQKASRATIVSFLRSLDQFQGRLRFPTRVFRLLLVMPYVDAETEALVGDFLKKIVAEVKSASPHLLSEFSMITSAHLDTVFAKIRKNFISLRGVARKEDLIAAILATLLEKYANAPVLAEVSAFFKDDGTGSRTPPVAQLRSLMAAAPREEWNRLEACIPLFALQDKKDKLPVFNQVARVDLNRPFNMRRLNRLIRVAGSLEIKTTGKRIQEILEFSRAERIHFLEETSIVTLCQLLTRSIIEQSREYFKEPGKNIRSLNGYIRGARFIPAKIMTGQLVHILQNPALSPPSRALVLDTLEHMDLAGMLRTLLPLFKVFDLHETGEDVVLRVGDLLARYGDTSIGHQALDLTSHALVAARRASVRILKALGSRGMGPSSENVTNRLYQLLEDPDRSVKVEALLALLSMEDDYAAQIVSDDLSAGAADIISPLLAGITKPLSRETFRLVMEMLRFDDAAVQESLRKLLPELSQGGYAEELRQNLLAALSSVPGSEPARPAPAPVTAADLPEQGSVLEQKKLDFKFRRANTQTLTVFFIDIAGFTEKSTSLDMSSLIKVVKAFEDIVGEAIEANRGDIVKKMGDGILAVFKHPLNAVMASLTIQRRISDYSAMKIDQEKFQARIGLNTGPVIRKDKDIFGEVVNVASRMQSAATPGDILLTDATYQEIREYTRCVELGRIQVKGVQEPVTTYSPEEVTVDVAKLAGTVGEAPAGGALRDSSLEKLKESMFVPRFAVPSDLASGAEIAGLLRGIFTDITRAVELISSDYHEEYEFKKYLQERWDMLVTRLSGSL